jgi:hypothetical protein
MSGVVCIAPEVSPDSRGSENKEDGLESMTSDQKNRDEDGRVKEREKRATVFYAVRMGPNFVVERQSGNGAGEETNGQ